MPKKLAVLLLLTLWRALRKQKLKKGQSGGYFFMHRRDKTTTNSLAQLVFNTLFRGVQKIPIRRSFRYKFILLLSPFTPALLVLAQISTETFKSELYLFFSRLFLMELIKQVSISFIWPWPISLQYYLNFH